MLSVWVNVRTHRCDVESSTAPINNPAEGLNIRGSTSLKQQRRMEHQRPDQTHLLPFPFFPYLSPFTFDLYMHIYKKKVSAAKKRETPMWSR